MSATVTARDEALELKVRTLHLPQVVALKLRRWLRRWLGIESDRTDMEAFATQYAENMNRLITRGDTHAGSIDAIAKQLNLTTLGAAEVTRRLEFYEHHVETLHYAKQRLDGKANGHGLIQIAGGAE